MTPPDEEPGVEVRTRPHHNDNNVQTDLSVDLVFLRNDRNVHHIFVTRSSSSSVPRIFTNPFWKSNGAHDTVKCWCDDLCRSVLACVSSLYVVGRRSRSSHALLLTQQHTGITDIFTQANLFDKSTSGVASWFWAVAPIVSICVAFWRIFIAIRKRFCRVEETLLQRFSDNTSRDDDT